MKEGPYSVSTPRMSIRCFIFGCNFLLRKLNTIFEADPMIDLPKKMDPAANESLCLCLQISLPYSSPSPSICMDGWDEQQLQQRTLK